MKFNFQVMDRNFTPYFLLSDHFSGSTVWLFLSRDDPGDMRRDHVLHHLGWGRQKPSWLAQSRLFMVYKDPRCRSGKAVAAVTPRGHRVLPVSLLFSFCGSAPLLRNVSVGRGSRSVSSTPPPVIASSVGRWTARLARPSRSHPTRDNLHSEKRAPCGKHRSGCCETRVILAFRSLNSAMWAMRAQYVSGGELHDVSVRSPSRWRHFNTPARGVAGCCEHNGPATLPGEGSLRCND